MDPRSNSFITRSNIANIFSIYLDRKLPNREMLRRLDEKIRSLEELPIDLDDCAELAVNISVEDTKELEELFGIEEESKIRDNLIDLSEKVKQRKESEIEKTYVKASEIVKITEERMSKEKEDSIALVEQQKQEHENRLNIEKEIQELRMRKSHLDTLIKRDLEEKETIEEDIEELNSQKNTVTKIINIFFLSLTISAIFLFGIKIIIPNWDIFEPIYLMISLIAPLTLILLSVVYGEFNPLNILEKISNLLQKKKRKKIKHLYERKNNIENRIMKNKQEHSSIIL